MRAAVVRAIASAPEFVEDRSIPTPGPGESLIRVTGAALGHLDVTVATGGFAGTPPLPYVPCGDGAGVIETSASLPPGTAVWIRGGGLGVVRDGLAADYAVVPDDALHAAPEGSDPVLAACFFSPATSAAVAVEELGQVAAGQRVLVTGAAGAVGSLTAQLALESGATVLGTVSRQARLADVPAGVQAHVGDPDITDPVDLLVDTIGGPGLTDRLALIAPGGRAVLVGYTAGTTLTLDLPTWLRRDVALLPLNMIRRAPSAFERADDLLRRLSAGSLQLPVTSFGLDAVNQAWEALRTNTARGRVVLVT